jgi:hypothetical protein
MIGSSPQRQRFERNALWAVFGILATLLVGAIGLYFSMRHPASSLTVRILRESNVLDVHQPVKDLAILYRGQDIQGQSKNLRIITVSVANAGEVDIRQADYDLTQPWGLRIYDAEIVEAPKIVDASTSYLREQVLPKSTPGGLIEFNKVILEHGKSFVVEFLVLHENDKLPRIETVGKITGIDEQIVVAATDVNEIGFWQRVFYGEMWVQIVRILVIAIGTVIFVIGTVAAIAGISSLWDKAKARACDRKYNGPIESYLLPAVGHKNSLIAEAAKILLAISGGEVKILEAFGRSLENIADSDLWLAFNDPDKRFRPAIFEESRVDSPKGHKYHFEVRPGVPKLLHDIVAFMKKHPLDQELKLGLLKMRSLDANRHLRIGSELLEGDSNDSAASS